MNDKTPMRTVYFDYLRVFATLAVVILHVSASAQSSTDVNSSEWMVFNCFNSAVRWGVPVFVMISGALFLNSDIGLRKMYSKYILRLAVAFVFWSAIYAIVRNGSNTDKIISFVKGEDHLWYIFLIIGIYMCIPFIRQIVVSEKMIKYFLLLSLIFTFVIPECVRLMSDFGNEFVVKLGEAVNNDLYNMTLRIPSGYVGYFILGYYLDKTDLKKHKRTVIYFSGIIGFVFTVLLTLAVSLKAQQVQDYYNNLYVNVLVMAVAVFVLFYNAKFEDKKINKIMQKLSKYSFGVYLVHPAVISLLNKAFGLNTMTFNPVISVIVISGIAFTCSYIISGILNKVPYANKYIV